MSNFDVIVIGSGINSLTAASLLGQAGRKVTLLEAGEQIGGMSSTEEFAKGFRCNTINDYIRWIDPRLLAALNLKEYGLVLNSPDIVRIFLEEEGKHITFHRSSKKTSASIKQHSESDAEKWPEFTDYIAKCSHFLEPLYRLTPPIAPKLGFRDTLKFKSFLKPLLKQGTKGLTDLIRLIPMMMPELMDEWFESEFLRGAVSSAGITRLTQGPFSAATGLNFLHQHVHAQGIIHNAFFVQGGTDQFARALTLAAKSAGVKIQTKTKVRSINTANGICSGITTNDGKIIPSDIVVSGLDPSHTFLKLVGASELSPTFTTQLKNIKYRGSTARVYFALNILPEIKDISIDQMDTVFSVSPSIDYLERAYDNAKYGRISDSPYLEFTFPSIQNPAFAPDGKHVLSASLQYIPYHLCDGKWTEEMHNKVIQNVNEVIEKYIPGFTDIVENTELRTPVDLEAQFGLTEGNLNHGEMTLDQFFFMRPTMSAAQYHTPIQNLYLCGPGTHPGGGLHGANAVNAINEITKY